MTFGLIIVSKGQHDISEISQESDHAGDILDTDLFLASGSKKRVAMSSITFSASFILAGVDADEKCTSDSRCRTQLTRVSFTTIKGTHTSVENLMRPFVSKYKCVHARSVHLGFRRRINDHCDGG